MPTFGPTPRFSPLYQAVALQNGATRARAPHLDLRKGTPLLTYQLMMSHVSHKEGGFNSNFSMVLWVEMSALHWTDELGNAEHLQLDEKRVPKLSGKAER